MGLSAAEKVFGGIDKAKLPHEQVARTERPKRERRTHRGDLDIGEAMIQNVFATKPAKKEA